MITKEMVESVERLVKELEKARARIRFLEGEIEARDRQINQLSKTAWDGVIWSTTSTSSSTNPYTTLSSG